MGVRVDAAGARSSGSETTYSDVRDRSADSNSAEAAKESQDHLPVPTSLAKSDITDRIGESEAA